MIVNTNIYNGGGITAPPIPSQSNEYKNFLKRKLNNEKDMQTHKGNDGKNIKEAKCKNEKKCFIHLEDNAQSWKKRHVEDKKIYENQNLGEIKNKNGTASSSLNSHTSHFNIITSNGFMSDLLDYEPNLLIPVSSNTTMAAEDGPIFTTNTSAICVNTTAEFESSVDDNWHASDLLELDHRYNSSLQTEITQLKPTIALKNSEIPLHSLSGHNNYSNPTGDSSFLMPPSRCTSIQRDLTLSPSKNENINNLSVNHENETDFEDKNLSWLLNFKFDELPHLSPDLSKSGRNVQSNSTTNNITSYQNSITQVSSVTSNPSNGYLNKEQSRSPKNITKVGKKFEELVMEVTSDIDGQHDCDSQQMTITTENNLQAETHILAQKKPPFTYTELIEYALEDKGELTVSGIYQWISDRFPYYKSNDDRWKNSVRHNLSINPHFRKGIKAPQGAGHLWTIYSGDSAENVLAWEHKKQRLELFFKMEAINRERVLEYHQQQKQQQRALKEEQTSRTFDCQPESDGITSNKVCGFDEAAVAVATLQQEMLQQQSGNSHCNGADNVLDANNHVLHTLPYADLLCSDEELRKTAGQILNGIHRDVEVQAVNQNIISTYQDVLLDNEDYLNPIHKDVAVNESGLSHSTPSSSLSHCTSSAHTSAQYYVADIDALGLGMQMSSRTRNLNHPSCGDNANGGEDPDVGLFNDEYNLNYFNYANVQDTIS